MTDNELTVNTKLDLSEVVNQCYYKLKKQGYFSEEIEAESRGYGYAHARSLFKCFETILASGLYQIMNDGEIKTDFNYLGNNNNVVLHFNTFTLNDLLKGETQ